MLFAIVEAAPDGQSKLIKKTKMGQLTAGTLTGWPLGGNREETSPAVESMGRETGGLFWKRTKRVGL
jgi:hypothetical protein